MLDFDRLTHFQKFQVTILGMIGEWARTYQCPDEMIERQIREAHSWVRCNPKKAPKKNILRFLNSWMKSAERYHNLRRKEYLPPPPIESEPVMTVEEMVAIRKKNMPDKFA
jgi:hypothetical protein